MTPAPLTVSADDNACRTGDINAVMASLPLSLRLSGAAADLVAIAGGPGWSRSAAAAINAGTRGLLVVNPVAEDIAEVRDAADRHGIPVVIDRPMAGNPAVPAAAAHFNDLATHRQLFESRHSLPVGADLSHALLDQVALVRRAFAPVQRSKLLVWNRCGYVVHGYLANGSDTILSTVATNAVLPSATLRLLSPTGAVELTTPEPVTARPARVTVTGPEGSVLLPTIYESSHRASWRRLHRSVVTGCVATDLVDLAADMLAIDDLIPLRQISAPR